MDDTQVIACRKVCKRYSEVPALCGLDLTVCSGRFHALLGPSGCGKTTALRLMAGLEVPDSGEIEIAQTKVNGPALFVPAEKRNLGMVFQEYALFPHLSVRENVGYGLRRDPHREDRIGEVLGIVGLGGLGDRMPSELSGGQQQRIALARALAPKPDVILLDEPFSNLDAVLRVRVRADVRRILREAKVTAVLVTHDQEEALSLADEVSVMMEGRIVQTDTPQRLYRHPASHQVATFMGEANFLPGNAENGCVACELGTLSTEQEVQGEVELMIRPEDVLLTKHDQGVARIVELEYFGHDQLIKFELPSGTTLRSRYIGNGGGFERDQHVTVTVNTSVTCFLSKYGCPMVTKTAIGAERL